MKIPRPEYPRPQFVRDNWLCLNGEWDFSFDTDTLDRRIIVPYPYQSRLSGIHENTAHDVVWYRRFFDLPGEMEQKVVLLHFGAVDYACRLWVNGVFVLEHQGGHVPFEADITDLLQKTGNEIRLRVHDPVADMEIPRGKQYWKEQSDFIFYTRSSGIWQSVWLEAVAPTHLAHVAFTPDIDNARVAIEYSINGTPGALGYTVTYEGRPVAGGRLDEPGESGSISVFIDHYRLGYWSFLEDMVWTPETPRLFDVCFEVEADGSTTDRVTSYFGMRKVSVENGKFLLNNWPYYQKLVLDQGYWPQSVYAAPDDKAYVRDIQMAKEMGFNGARKHQKIEDPRFLYHADRLGFLVWEEMPAAYRYTSRYVRRASREWMEAVLRDYSHPCVVAWVPLNESWGVFDISTRQDIQNHSVAMVALTKSLDCTRPVMGNDGWEHTCSDLLTIHDYEPEKQVLSARYASMERILDFRPGKRRLFASGFAYDGQPVLLSEFGGISFAAQKVKNGWGYSDASSPEDYLRRYRLVMEGVYASEILQGFCYTQLYDVEQEINGLLTYDREYKADPAAIRQINNGR